LVFILKIPFSLLGIVVSEEFGRKAELSIYGKLIKSVIMLVIILLGTAADLNSFGLLRKIWSYVKGLLAVFTQ